MKMSEEESKKEDKLRNKDDLKIEDKHKYEKVELP